MKGFVIMILKSRKSISFRNNVFKYLSAFLFFSLVPSIGCLNITKTKVCAVSNNTTKKIGENMNLIEEFKKNKDVKVKVNINGKVEEILFSEYIFGVVAAEIGYNSPVEALKAQAVAAASYAVFRKGLNGEYPTGTCFQCYINREQRIKSYGEEKVNLVENAIRPVISTVMLCDNRLIESVYCTCHPKYSKPNNEVWGGSPLKYLSSVYSPEVDYFDNFSKLPQAEKNKILEDAKKYFINYDKTEAFFNNRMSSLRRTYKIKINDVFDAVKKKNNSANRPQNDNEIIKNIATNDKGYVTEVEIFGVKISGADLKVILKLSSSSFTARVENGEIVFECLGAGHAVGMSQIGAEVLALQGKNYQEILKHFYSNDIQFAQLYDLKEEYYIR